MLPSPRSLLPRAVNEMYNELDYIGCIGKKLFFLPSLPSCLITYPLITAIVCHPWHNNHRIFNNCNTQIWKSGHLVWKLRLVSKPRLISSTPLWILCLFLLSACPPLRITMEIFKQKAPNLFTAWCPFCAASNICLWAARVLQNGCSNLQDSVLCIYVFHLTSPHTLFSLQVTEKLTLSLYCWSLLRLGISKVAQAGPLVGKLPCSSIRGECRVLPSFSLSFHSAVLPPISVFFPLKIQKKPQKVFI